MFKLVMSPLPLSATSSGACLTAEFSRVTQISKALSNQIIPVWTAVAFASFEIWISKENLDFFSVIASA